MKWGQRSEKEGAQLFTYEGLKLQSSDGEKIDLDNYLYFNDTGSAIIPSICASPGLSSDGLLLLTRDNTTEITNSCQSNPLGAFTFEAAAIYDATEYGQLYWTNASGALGYIVYRSEESPTGAYVQIFSGLANNYEDYGVSAGGNYYWYSVVAFNNVYVSSGISTISSGTNQIVYFP